MTNFYLANLFFTLFSLQYAIVDATHQSTGLVLTDFTSAPSDTVSSAQSIASSTIASTMISSTQNSMLISPTINAFTSDSFGTSASSSSLFTSVVSSTMTSTVITASSATTSVSTSTAMSPETSMNVFVSSRASTVISSSPITSAASTGAFTSILPASSTLLTTVSTGGTSAATTVTSNVPSSTSATLTTNLTRVYQFRISSSAQLRTGIITDSASLQSLVLFIRSSFNLTSGTSVVNVTQAKIQNVARSSTGDLVAEVLFNAAGFCSDVCLNQRAIPITPTMSVSLPATDGSLIQANANAPGIFVAGSFNPAIVTITTTTTTTTTTASSTETFTTGEPPPGLAAKLGMGLGISFLAVIIIAEIVFFKVIKGRLPSLNRGSDYELTDPA